MQEMRDFVGKRGAQAEPDEVPERRLEELVKQIPLAEMITD
ncbi:MAG: hypothetical protein VYD18_14600 [Candidatus Latescibacterota bacterium]|nr:hypothetical protein [Candidatus Latescibacterota bacterium]